MSAVESEEHTELAKNPDVDEAQRVLDEATPHHNDENIPEGSTIEHTHYEEHHVYAGQSVEETTIELSSDTHGEIVHEHQPNFGVDQVREFLHATTMRLTSVSVYRSTLSYPITLIIHKKKSCLNPRHITL